MSSSYSAHLHTYLLPSFFFFNDTATTEIYTLSLHDALPISTIAASAPFISGIARSMIIKSGFSSSAFLIPSAPSEARSEEHTSELQSPDHLVCRLLLEKKKKQLRVILLSITTQRVTITCHHE